MCGGSTTWSSTEMIVYFTPGVRAPGGTGRLTARRGELDVQRFQRAQEVRRQVVEVAVARAGRGARPTA